MEDDSSTINLFLKPSLKTWTGWCAFCQSQRGKGSGPWWPGSMGWHQLVPSVSVWTLSVGTSSLAAPSLLFVPATSASVALATTPPPWAILSHRPFRDGSYWWLLVPRLFQHSTWTLRLSHYDHTCFVPLRCYSHGSLTHSSTHYRFTTKRVKPSQMDRKKSAGNCFMEIIVL